MQIHGFNKITLLDYPEHLASTIFLGSCNMRCPFCHNSSLVLNPSSVPTIPIDEILLYLEKRKNILEGVCITGGEPTLSPDLPYLIKKIRHLGLKIKLDTNGSRPDILKTLMEEGLLNYVAIDIKNSKEKYSLSAGVQNYSIENISESVTYLMNCQIPYEFRTTIIKEHHTAQDILSIGHWIEGAKAYYLQPYKNSDDILSPGLHSHSKETLSYFITLLTPFVELAALRGID
jgi:pyruvate formate lyase activating enzyme